MSLTIIKSSDECPVKITEAALSQFKGHKEAQNDPDIVAVRIGVKGGGCSGFMHNLEFIKQSEIDTDEDSIYLIGDMQFVIDCFSEPYLSGTTIDYLHTLKESGFKFLSDAVKRTCGCGASFSG